MPVETKHWFASAPDGLVDVVVQRIAGDQCDLALVGPVLPYARGGTETRFVLVSGKLSGGTCIHSIETGGGRDAETFRATIVTAIMLRCRPIVVYDVDDEMELARLGKAIWPERFTAIR